jgi:hypothetical protein
LLIEELEIAVLDCRVFFDCYSFVEFAFMLSKLRECANRDLTTVKFRKLSSNGCWSFDETIYSRVGGSCQPNSDSLKIQLSQEAAPPPLAQRVDFSSV